MTTPIPIAFYTPTKGLSDTGTSGERPITRAALDLLKRAGFAPRIASTLVTLDREGSADVQDDLIRKAAAEADRVVKAETNSPPALWYTYHSYYKCPDLVGPHVSAQLGIPYVLQQPTLNPKHLDGPWARFAEASAKAHAHADCLLWSTRRDVPALEAAGLGAKLAHLPPVIDPGAVPVYHSAQSPLRLLTVAMMPEGDKLESYRRLAASLAHLSMDWRLAIAGVGPARAEVETMFAHYPGKVDFLGRFDRDAVEGAYRAADLLVWPGVGEGIGMVYLEAQAAGLPVIAEDRAAQRDIIEGPLAPCDNPKAFAGLVEQAAEDRPARACAARALIEERHTPEVVAPLLSAALTRVLA